MTPSEHGQGLRTRVICRLISLAALVWAAGSVAQAGFQIVWVVVGEAATSDASGAPRAGRRLFDAGDLAALSLDNVRIARVDVEPVVTELRIGQRWCMSSLAMRAFGPERELVPEAPLSITVRQDHREHIGLKRSRKDICLRPTAAGEYPIRLTSLLPASDGTMRGAQIFVRVSDPHEQHSKAEADAQGAETPPPPADD